MKRVFAVIMITLLSVCIAVALGEGYNISSDNEEHFALLLAHLVRAYEQPSESDDQTIDADLMAIQSVRASDYDVAFAIADHWRRVYLNSDYSLYMYSGEDSATALEATGIEDKPSHAIVVLGYELLNGEMTDELRGRCDAAAAVARFCPNAILVCSGGPTGDNNPEGHTEAGLMRDYLVDQKGIDAARIKIDTRAMTTVDNALNTFEILRSNGVKTMTIVTSGYHQRWGQAIYNAVGALYRQENGYQAEIVGNYCCDIPPSNAMFEQDDRICARQLGKLLGLSKPVLEKLKSVLPV